MQYFIDESGDTTLFDRHGKVLIGNGASKFFMLGCVEIADHDGLAVRLSVLRQNLVADPLLRSVPSMQINRGKTALFFHAKDDLPEVRHAVFKQLLNEDFKFYAAVMDKKPLLFAARHIKQRDPAYRYNPHGHDSYDDLVFHLDNLLMDSADLSASSPTALHRQYTFARRGQKDRTGALIQALNRSDLQILTTTASDAQKRHSLRLTTFAKSDYPVDQAGLQVCDYMLWALSRLYEREDARFFNAMRAKMTSVLDFGRGIFNEKRPLTLEHLAGVQDRAED